MFSAGPHVFAAKPLDFLLQSGRNVQVAPKNTDTISLVRVPRRIVAPTGHVWSSSGSDKNLSAACLAAGVNVAVNNLFLADLSLPFHGFSFSWF